ncbi:tetratricopeptide repeat protein [Helicobacter cynogastricus]|uniref:tetratricopeptide repeat protein n=1 Tax=Helicobacter cynogastricus TaxID=329937 RepID=UPI000CF1421C|nr:SEL1-like repeat protein [Helicobacter cynogastricus]
MFFKRALVAMFLASYLLGVVQASSLEKLYEQGHTAYQSTDFKAALKAFQQMAKMGGADAYLYLSDMYSNGLGVKEDKVQAKAYRLKATQAFEKKIKAGKGAQRDSQDHASAYERLGYLYKDDQKTIQKALQYYQKAKVYLYLGEMYEYGHVGLKKNRKKAKEFYTKALQIKDQKACATQKLVQLHHKALENAPELGGEDPCGDLSYGGTAKVFELGE